MKKLTITLNESQVEDLIEMLEFADISYDSEDVLYPLLDELCRWRSTQENEKRIEDEESCPICDSTNLLDREAGWLECNDCGERFERDDDPVFSEYEEVDDEEIPF